MMFFLLQYKQSIINILTTTIMIFLKDPEASVNNNDYQNQERAKLQAISQANNKNTKSIWILSKRFEAKWNEFRWVEEELKGIYCHLHIKVNCMYTLKYFFIKSWTNSKEFSVFSRVPAFITFSRILLLERSLINFIALALKHQNTLNAAIVQ